jgi:hypothetical protein
MTVRSVQAGISPWAAACFVIALVSIYAFLQDLIAPDWPAFFLSPLLVVGFRWAVGVAPRDSLVRAALYQAAVLIVPFTAIYSVADAAFKTDWQPWVIAATTVIGFWATISMIAEVEAE